MRHDEIWKASTGEQLVLGAKVGVAESSPYHQDHSGVDFFITGMHFNKDGESINITIGERLDSLESDGWTVFDLLLRRD